MKINALIQSVDVMKDSNGQDRVTKTGKYIGQSMYALTLLDENLVPFNLFRTAHQLAHDLKNISEIEYPFLTGTELSLPEGELVEAGADIVDTTTGLITKAKSRQFRIEDGWATRGSFGINYMEFKAICLERRSLRKQPVVVKQQADAILA